MGRHAIALHGEAELRVEVFLQSLGVTLIQFFLSGCMRELTFVLVLGKRVLFICLVLHDGDHFEVIEIEIRLVKTGGHVDNIE